MVDNASAGASGPVVMPYRKNSGCSASNTPALAAAHGQATDTPKRTVTHSVAADDSAVST